MGEKGNDRNNKAGKSIQNARWCGGQGAGQGGSVRGEGEFVAVMGSSGSGKSTLLHMIGGVDNPTSGKVVIDGENIHKMKPSEQAVFRRRKVGIIYQAYNLIPTLTVEENIVLPLRLESGKKSLSEQLRMEE